MRERERERERERRVMETLLKVGLFSIFNSGELKNQSPPLIRTYGFRRVHGFSRRKTPRVSVFRSSMPVNELLGEDVLQMFLKERQLKGDFVSKASDIIWRRDGLKFLDSETGMLDEIPRQLQEVVESETDYGFLKLTETHEWVLGNKTAPINKKADVKELRNDSERRKRLNFLKYDALKREMMLLTIGIGTICSGYCLVSFSIQVAISYAAGVLFSCLYLQLLYYHADNLSREAVPRIFMQKKSKKIGIRSEDLKNVLESSVKGCAMALSSPRLMIPVAIYGIWGLSHHFSNDYFGFQLVPAMFGMFAYKAAALVQVYRDNEDLRLIFPENDEGSNY